MGTVLYDPTSRNMIQMPRNRGTIGRFSAASRSPTWPNPITLKPVWLPWGRGGQQVTARIVKPIDTLWSLAQAYCGNGLKMSAIQCFNSLAPADVIRPGQILLIPEPALPGDDSVRPAPAGLTASPQLGGRVKH